MSKDSIDLLKECDAGISMGVSALDKVVSKVESRKLSKLICDSKKEHENLKNDALILLGEKHESGKAPQPIAKLMSDIKINVKLFVSQNDTTICEIIKDGCDMGIKSIKGYMRKYDNAESDAKKIASKVIQLEENLLNGIKEFI